MPAGMGLVLFGFKFSKEMMATAGEHRQWLFFRRKK